MELNNKKQTICPTSKVTLEVWEVAPDMWAVHVQGSECHPRLMTREQMDNYVRQLCAMELGKAEDDTTTLKEVYTARPSAEYVPVPNLGIDWAFRDVLEGRQVDKDRIESMVNRMMQFGLTRLTATQVLQAIKIHYQMNGELQQLRSELGKTRNDLASATRTIDRKEQEAVDRKATVEKLRADVKHRDDALANRAGEITRLVNELVKEQAEKENLNAKVKVDANELNWAYTTMLCNGLQRGPHASSVRSSLISLGLNTPTVESVLAAMSTHISQGKEVRHLSSVNNSLSTTNVNFLKKINELEEKLEEHEAVDRKANAQINSTELNWSIVSVLAGDVRDKAHVEIVREALLRLGVTSSVVADVVNALVEHRKLSKGETILSQLNKDLSVANLDLLKQVNELERDLKKPATMVVIGNAITNGSQFNGIRVNNNVNWMNFDPNCEVFVQPRDGNEATS